MIHAAHVTLCRMGRPRPAEPVKLICGMLSGDADLLRRARQLLVRRFGPVDLETPVWPFTQTDYYREEMGPNLLRQLISFERVIQPDAIAVAKLETNEIEERVAEDMLDPEIPRPLNLDPGYVDLGKLVLATTKDRAHRIYLSGGIYAETTLHYAHDDWQIFPWTYPDYREAKYHAFLTAVRQRLHDVRRQRDADVEAGE